MRNIWSNKARVKGFDCKYITFKVYVSMFECTEIEESIYEGVVDFFY